MKIPKNAKKCYLCNGYANIRGADGKNKPCPNCIGFGYVNKDGSNVTQSKNNQRR